jgi:hypothetical protein
METVKFRTPTWGLSVSDMSPEDYDVAYALWKMGTPANTLAPQYSVNPWELDYLFELRYKSESRTDKLKAPKTN